MKIKTITCHDVYNYGASLQAYALMHYLEIKGHEVEIIDYKPDYLSRHYQLRVANPVYDKPIVKYIYLLAKLYPYLRSLKRKRLFDEFRNKYLKLTSIRYQSNEELKKNPPIADLYLAGSDQIWNTLFPNGKDSAFYLDFVPQRKIRASYAASMATDKVASGWEKFVSEKVMNLDQIAVREETAVSALKQIGVTKNISVVCDPVFLLSSDDWKKFIKDSLPIVKSNYILVYDFDRNNNIKEIAQYIAKKEGLKIIPIGITSFGARANYTNSIGPIEFLNLVYYAKCVISNSFHATAFSIIFQKPFYVVRRKESLNTRMQDLLKRLSLTERLISSTEDIKSLNIDYQAIQDVIQNHTFTGKEFLKKIIG